MNMKEHFRETIKDLSDYYCGGWTCLSDDEIRYCEADVEVTEEIKLFFKVWCPRNDEVLFILFKDGTHDYYNVHYHIIVGRNAYLYIEDIWGNTMHIPYTDIEDYAVGTKKPGESALSAIPEWFEDRIDEYTEKLKEKKKMNEKWYLYYVKDSHDRDVVLIAKTLDDAEKFAEECYMDSNVRWMCEADKWDIKVKDTASTINGASVLMLTQTDAGSCTFATQKYADKINYLKFEYNKETRIPTKEKFLSMFNVGSYYKISYTDDLIEGDKDTFCIIRFKEYLYDNSALFENIYDHHMGLVPDIKVDMFNIRNDDYTIVKIPYGGEIRE